MSGRTTGNWPECLCEVIDCRILISYKYNNNHRWETIMKLKDLKEEELIEEGATGIPDDIQILGISPGHPDAERYKEAIRSLRKTNSRAYHKAITMD